MKRGSAWIAIMGFCLASAGCCMGGRIFGQTIGGLGVKHCSDCTPPYVPTFKYHSLVDDLVTWKTGKHCGQRALAQYRKQTGIKASTDFAAGFVQAYIDLAENRAPLPPSLPPSRYWMAYYRSCAGRPCIEEWYAGYNAGLDAGLQSGVSQFQRVDVRLAGCAP